MKVIKYQLCTEVNHGTEDEPKIEQVFSTITLKWSEDNEKIAKAEAYNGEYTIEEELDNRPFEEIQTEKLSSLSEICNQTIVAGMDVESTLNCSGVISSQLSYCTNSIFSGESVSSTSLRQFV